MLYHSGGYKELSVTSGERNTRRISIPEIWSGQFLVRFGCQDHCATLALAQSRCVTGARDIIQWLAIICSSKEALNSCAWPGDNSSNKSNIPEAVEKSNDYTFFNIGHFCSGGLWGSLFFFWCISGSINPWKCRIIKMENPQYYSVVNRGQVQSQ